MIKGIDLKKRLEYVSKHDEDEVKTIFVFRPLTASEMMDMMGDGTSVTLKGSKIVDYLNDSICEIKNAEFSDKREYIDSLPSLVISELIGVASSLNNMSSKDEKN